MGREIISPQSWEGKRIAPTIPTPTQIEVESKPIICFITKKRLQYFTKPERPDAVYAKKLQELIGGPFGEMTVMMQYLFQGWNCRGPVKYKDMMLDIGTEEIGHIEMVASLIAHLLDKAPVEQQEEAAKDPIVQGVMGGMKAEDIIMASMNPQHATVSGGGAIPADSVGYPWNGRFIIASGNLMADFLLECPS